MTKSVQKVRKEEIELAGSDESQCLWRTQPSCSVLCSSWVSLSCHCSMFWCLDFVCLVFVYAVEDRWDGDLNDQGAGRLWSYTLQVQRSSILFCLAVECHILFHICQHGGDITSVEVSQQTRRLVHRFRWLLCDRSLPCGLLPDCYQFQGHIPISRNSRGR